MLRVRFKVSSDDYRPLRWPLKHPYWCTGQGEDYYILVSYADDEEYIMKNWPDAFSLDAEEAEEYFFNDRFPKPDWLGKYDEEPIMTKIGIQLRVFWNLLTYKLKKMFD